MRVKNTVVIVQLSNKKFHQVMLSKKEEALVLSLIMNFDDVLKVSEASLDGMVLPTPTLAKDNK